MRSYTKLWDALCHAGVNARWDGPADEHYGTQVSILIHDEQETGGGVILYFNIDENGNETFVCQE